MSTAFIEALKARVGESSSEYKERVSESGKALTVNALKSILESKLSYEGRLGNKKKADLIDVIVEIKQKEHYPSEFWAAIPKT